MTEGYFVYTSNVDGHFARAGFDKLRILECHGRFQSLQCSRTADHGTWGAAKQISMVWTESEVNH